MSGLFIADDSRIRPLPLDFITQSSAILAKKGTRPWYSRRLWVWRIRRFERGGVSS